MSNNAYIDRGIIASLEDRSRRKLSGSLGKEGQPIMQKFIISRLTGSQYFCNAINTSYADPPKINEQWTENNGYRVQKRHDPLPFS
jgi:hypothetical protein